jgi:hypothetical protein
MAQAASRRPLAAEAGVQSHLIPCGICGGQSDSATGFSPNSSVSPRQHHSTGAPDSFIHLSPTLYNLSN